MITIFGSINIDLVMAVPHFAVPGETVTCPAYQLIPGGKGANQAVAAARAGSTVTFFGKVGKDSLADLALKSLQEAKVNTSRVSVGSGLTGCATIAVIPEGENTIMVASGANLELKADDV